MEEVLILYPSIMYSIFKLIDAARLWSYMGHKNFKASH